MTKISVENRYLNALSHVFTPLVLNKIIEDGYSKYLNEVLVNSNLMQNMDLSQTFYDFLESVYAFLFVNYRNEYLYKNEIANTLFYEKHSPYEACMLNEFRVGQCRADVVILNGTSTVYEIKSQFDSFARLDTQINAYRDIFDYIYVVTSENQANNLLKKLPEMVGIMSISDDKSINTLRESSSNKKNIRPNVLFDSLRKNEYLEIINNLYGYVPSVPNTQIFQACKELFCKQDVDIIHNQTIEILKKRNERIDINSFLNSAPKSLYAYIINNARDGRKLKVLESKYELEMKKITKEE